MPSKDGFRAFLGAAVIGAALAVSVVSAPPAAAAKPLCGHPMPDDDAASEVTAVDAVAVVSPTDPSMEVAFGRGIATHEEVEPLWNANLYHSYTADDLVLTHGTNPRNRFYLQETAAYAFTLMRLAAEAEGHRLQVGSAWRSWRRQLRAYDGFQRTGRNLNGTPVPNIAHPCDSKHPPALAVDMKVKPSSRFERWLEEHAATYGFKRTRSDEPWEWQFIGIEAASMSRFSSPPSPS